MQGCRSGSAQPALLAVFRTLMNPGDLHHKQVRLALKLSARLDEPLAEHKEADALLLQAATEFQETAINLLAVVTACAQACVAMTPPRRLFNTTIKYHYVLHIALNSHHLSPRLGWCYSGEDFKRAMKLLASTCCKPRTAFNVFQKMNEKYLLGLHHTFLDGGLLLHR